MIKELVKLIDNRVKKLISTRSNYKIVGTIEKKIETYNMRNLSF